MSITDRLSAFMRSKNILQKDLAKCLGVTPQNVSGIFNGKQNITTEQLVIITKKYTTLNLRWLLTGIGDMNEPSYAYTLTQPDQNVTEDSYSIKCKLCEEKDKRIEILERYNALLEGRNQKATSG